MAGRTFQSDYLANRAGGGRETFESYGSGLERRDVAVTHCRYALLVAVFALNLSLSVLATVLAVHVQLSSPSDATAERWKVKNSSSWSSGSKDWTVCYRPRVTDSERSEPLCAVVDDDFCRDASEVWFIPHKHSHVYCNFANCVILYEVIAQCSTYDGEVAGSYLSASATLRQRQRRVHKPHISGPRHADYSIAPAGERQIETILIKVDKISDWTD